MSTLVDRNAKLRNEEDGMIVDKEMCQRLVWRFIYLSHTRPNIGFVVSLVGQFIHQQMEAHFQVALN